MRNADRNNKINNRLEHLSTLHHESRLETTNRSGVEYEVQTATNNSPLRSNRSKNKIEFRPPIASIMIFKKQEQDHTSGTIKTEDALQS